MAQQNLIRDYDFVLEPNKNFHASTGGATFLKVWEFQNSDPSKPVNLVIQLNNGIFTKLRAGTSMDFTTIQRSLTSSGEESVQSFTIRNDGDSTITGTISVSLGKIVDNTLALDDSTTTNGIPSSITNTPLPVVDIASLDDSGIILNSVMEFPFTPTRGDPANQNITAPSSYSMTGTATLSYTGLEIGKRYAYDFERIESLPQWWGEGAGHTGNGGYYRFDLAADIRVFAYNGQGATQKRGFRRGGIKMAWSGEKKADSYGNVLVTNQGWRHAAGAYAQANYAGSLSFTEQTVERNPFIFDASATTLSLQFLVTATLCFDLFGGNAGVPFNFAGANKGYGGFVVRSSVQPINSGALT